MTEIKFDIPAKSLGVIAKCISSVRPECIVNIGNNRIASCVVDTSNVCMISVTAPIAFNTNESNKIGLDFNKINDMIRVCPQICDTIKTTILTGDTHDKIIFNSGNFAYGLLLSGSYRNLVEPRVDNILNIKLPQLCVVDGDELYNAIASMRSVADGVIFDISDKSLELISLYDDYKLILGIPTLSANVCEHTQTKVSVDYLTDIVSLMQGCGDVVINTATSMPIQFKFSKCDVDITYMLAPRVPDAPPCDRFEDLDRYLDIP